MRSRAICPRRGGDTEFQEGGQPLVGGEDRRLPCKGEQEYVCTLYLAARPRPLLDQCGLELQRSDGMPPDTKPR
jgi:hypothetical protein